MHPRLLAKTDCSGGTCPAVYDDDTDLLPGELAIVGKRPSTGLLARLADRIAPDEVAGVIRREIVADALCPADEPVDLAGLMAQLETFSYSAFRLETLQHYDGTGRDEQWEALLRTGRRWGKTFQRVHVVAEPLTPAMQQELTEGYSPNVAAGEDIGIISCPEGDGWPDDVPRHDFWIFDGSLVYEMDYNPDGTWAGARRVRDPERIISACRGREAALHRATSWRTYMASRPDLQRRLAQ
ncbi:MAG: DUF6879 family protein [Streptosporangiaceae bacterium]